MRKTLALEWISQLSAEFSATKIDKHFRQTSDNLGQSNRQVMKSKLKEVKVRLN
jgi:hypothetical protein